MTATPTATSSALSSSQAAMWATSQFRDGGFYLEQIVVRFTSPPDAEPLEKAWQRTVAAIPALRIVTDGNAAVMVDAAPDQWTIHDGSFDAAGPEALLEADRRAGFRDHRKPAWRCQYWPADGVLLWTVHHALLDGRSMAAVLRHFLLLAAGLDPGAAPEWVGCLSPDEAETSRACSAMAGLALPPRADEEPFAWGGGDAGIPWRIRLPLANDLREKLTSRAQACGSTVHGLVQWAWAWAVARLAGYEQLSLGVVRSAHWQLPSTKTAAGYLMTTVPVPARMEHNTTVGDALRRYREAVLAVRDFTRADSREMGRALGRPAALPWDAVVMTENGSLGELVYPQLPDGLVASIVVHERTGEPLTASACLGKQSAIEIEALPERFSEVATRRLAATWLKAIELVVTASHDAPLGSLDPLPDDCLRLIGDHESGGPALASTTGGIWQAFHEVATRTPDAPARLCRGVVTSYRELMAAAESLAAKLVDLGVTGGDRVASRLDDRRHAPVVVLACARIQAVYLPFDADIPPERLRSMLAIAEPAAIICDNAGSSTAGIPTLDPAALEPGKTPAKPFAAHDAYLPFCLLFTSGSTGEPKGVLNHHYGILNEVMAVGENARFPPGRPCVAIRVAGI
jgi:nonribosomal peptide synthetase CepB